MTNLDDMRRSLQPQRPPDDDDNVPWNPELWNPEFPVLEPSHNLLLESGPWTVPYADFTPPPSPFALEMRAESIEQLVGGDALRRGESERIEAGRSGTNADQVAGRDRVRVQGTLHEHTGHGLAEQVAHLDTTVDGRLDVHTGNEDMVLLAGHMKDVWDGGTAIVAAMTDDLVAGGGVRVTAPLDLWVHGLMGVEERIGTCTADAVLLELGATHYEREYGPGVHAAGLAVYTGSLYLSNRSTFRPLMRVSSGVRNLIAAGGDGGAGGAPGASPPPAPAAGGAGTVAVSETLSVATDSLRSAEAVVEDGARLEDVTGVRHSPDLSDTVHAGEFATPDDQSSLAAFHAMLEDFRRWRDEPGDLTEVTRSTNAAEQIAALQHADFTEIDSLLRGMNEQVLEMDESIRSRTLGGEDGIAPPSLSGTDDPHHAGEPHDAHSPVPGGDESDLDLSRFDGYELPHMEEPQNPADATWETNFGAFTGQLQDHRQDSNWAAVHEYEPAAMRIVAKVMSAYSTLAGNVGNLVPTGDVFSRAHEAYRRLEEMLLVADQAHDWQRADDIRQALDKINLHTYDVVVDFASRSRDFSQELYPKLAAKIDAIKLEKWVQQRISAAVVDFGEAQRLGETEDLHLARGEADYWRGVRHEIAAGRDPTVNSGAQIVHLHSNGHHVRAEMLAGNHARLRGIMDDPRMLMPGPAADTFAELYPKLAPHIDPTKLDGWVEQQFDKAMFGAQEANRRSDDRGVRLGLAEVDYWQGVREDIAAGRDPTVDSSAQITRLHENGEHAQAEALAEYDARLRAIMDDTAMFRPEPSVRSVTDASFPGSPVADPGTEATVSGRSEVDHLTQSEIEFITRPTGDRTGSGLGAATDRHWILDPNIHVENLRSWAEDRLSEGILRLEDPNVLDDFGAVARQIVEFDFYGMVRGEAAEGHDPTLWGHNLMTQLLETGDTEGAQQIADLQMHLHDAMSDPWIRNPAASVGDSLIPGRAGSPTGAAPETSPPDLYMPTTESGFPFGPGDSGPGSDGAVLRLTPDSAAWLVEPGASRPPDTNIGYSSIQWDSGRLQTGAEGSHPTTSLRSTHGVLLPETGAGTPIPTDGGLHRGPTGMQSPLHGASFGSAHAAETSGLQDIGRRPPGWQDDETPGFGRVAADFGHFPVSRREAIVDALKGGELMPESLYRRLTGRFTYATMSTEINPRSRESKDAAALLGDLRQIADDARRTGSSTANYDNIDYLALYFLLAMLDSPAGPQWV